MISTAPSSLLSVDVASRAYMLFLQAFLFFPVGQLFCISLIATRETFPVIASFASDLGDDLCKRGPRRSALEKSFASNFAH